MWRTSLGWVAIAAGLNGCAASHDAPAPPSGVVRIHNAIDFGLASSAYIVVGKVDGVAVHRKFDRDPYVEVGAGRRRIEVRFYSESLSASRHGLENCSIELEGEGGGSYYLEGGVGRSRWWARIIDSNGVARPCVFRDGATEGMISGGDQDLTVSALPSAAPTTDHAAVMPTPLPAKGPSPAAAPGVADGARRAEQIVAPAEVPAARDALPKGDDSEVTAHRASSGGDEYFLISAMRGRGHRGCAAGRYLVGDVSGEVLSLKGNERVRLLGVVPVPDGDGVDGEFTEALRGVVGRCVEIELDPGLGERGHHDRDGNLLAYVKTEDGVLLNAEVLRLGLASVDTGWRGRYLAELLAAQAAADAAVH